MSGESKTPNEPAGTDHQTETGTAEGVTNSPPSSLSTTTLFDVLANQRRRYAIHALKEHETPIALADLADEVAVRENEISSPEVPAEDVKRVYASLWHAHIPKLVDGGIIECHRDRRTVALAENAEQLEPYLEQAITE